jgi:hypothetical protein
MLTRRRVPSCCFPFSRDAAFIQFLILPRATYALAHVFLLFPSLQHSVPNTNDETVKQNHPATRSSIRDQGANTCLCYRHFIKYLFIHEKRNQRLVPSLASILSSPLGGGLQDKAREDEEEKKKLVSAHVLNYNF